MSEAQLKKFIAVVENEDGVSSRGTRTRISGTLKRRQQTARLLQAAQKGKIELPDDESYLASSAASDSALLDDSLARKGYSLVEQMREQRSADFAERNLKYAKHARKHAIHEAEAEKILKSTRRPPSSVRQQREQITGLRETKKQRKSDKNKSVFSEKDFDVFKKKQVGAIDMNELW